MGWLTFGTRGSPLALAQTRMAAAALAVAHGRGEGAIRFDVVKTVGDMVQDRPLAEIGGKALWTKELDAALRNRRIDAAVHSLKDVETFIPDGIVIAAILPRADPRDRMVGAPGLTALPEGARFGTSSPRRAAQALSRRPDLQIVSFRGNVETRIRKVAAGEAEATLLAAAGLDRLGHDGVGVAQSFDDFLPAPSQAAVAITAREADADTRSALAAIDCAPTRACVMAERALLAALGAGCHSCVAAHATLSGGDVTTVAELLLADGSERVRDEIRSSTADAREAAADLARRLLAGASPALRATFGAG
ncbi:MAG: hydroxymethylbilane synthase [Sphingomonadaceae bacterium]|nr:hydroxymethylbilane synthase [Sphingomonadaceae bacterium]